MEKNSPLGDDFGRRFPYLRLSITDVCNFRCTYCLPNGYKKTACESFLKIDEIARLVRAFAAMGTWKIRLTGGEPTIRKDFLEIAKQVAATPGIRRLAMTTNGYKLPQRAADYRAAGIDAINISIDSLDSEKFKDITGHDRLQEVLDGVNACIDTGFSSVKINTVLLKGVNDCELDGFIDFVSRHQIALRFIELMQTRDNADFFQAYHLSGKHLAERLIDRGWQVKPREEGAGPAIEFTKTGTQGLIGLIAPYSKDFCKTCNRLRVSARGDLHLCLFGEGGQTLRDLLQHDDQADELQDRVRSLMHLKKSGHFLHQGDSGATPHLASIGG